MAAQTHHSRPGRKSKKKLLLHQVFPLGCALCHTPPQLSYHDKAGVGVSLPAVETYELMVEKDLVTAV